MDITKEQLEEMKKELHFLKTDKIREIAELIRHTASHGDLKENFAYHDAKEKQAFLQGRILDLEAKVRSARVVVNRHDGSIQIGSDIKVLLNGQNQKISITGPGQSDPLNGKISADSPIGKAIIGKRAGDKVKIDNGEINIECEVVEVN